MDSAQRMTIHYGSSADRNNAMANSVVTIPDERAAKSFAVDISNDSPIEVRYIHLVSDITFSFSTVLCYEEKHLSNTIPDVALTSDYKPRVEALLDDCSTFGKYLTELTLNGLSGRHHIIGLTNFENVKREDVVEFVWVDSEGISEYCDLNDSPCED